jgi:hypothetical protein
MATHCFILVWVNGKKLTEGMIYKCIQISEQVLYVSMYTVYQNSWNLWCYKKHFNLYMISSLGECTLVLSPLYVRHTEQEARGGTPDPCSASKKQAHCNSQNVSQREIGAEVLCKEARRLQELNQAKSRRATRHEQAVVMFTVRTFQAARNPGRRQYA